MFVWTIASQPETFNSRPFCTGRAVGGVTVLKNGQDTKCTGLGCTNHKGHGRLPTTRLLHERDVDGRDEYKRRQTRKGDDYSKTSMSYCMCVVVETYVRQ
jgi:hypothetical protein